MCVCVSVCLHVYYDNKKAHSGHNGTAETTGRNTRPTKRENPVTCAMNSVLHSKDRCDSQA